MAWQIAFPNQSCMERFPWLAKVASRKAELLCAALLCLMALNLVGQVARKSITNDETVLIPAGYYHLIAGEFHLVYEHPPLCKILSAIPLLFLQPNELKPEQMIAGKSKIEQAWVYEMTFWSNNRTQFQAISFWTRLPMIALTLGLGVLLFVFTRDLFGPLAAVFAVVLFALEPTVLAHGRAVQTDIPATFGFVLLFYTMHRYTRLPTVRRAAWIGVACGLALLAKFSMLLSGPILLMFFAVRAWRDRNPKTAAAHLLAIGSMTIAVINAAYFFKHRELQLNEIEALQHSFRQAAFIIVPLTKVLSHVIPAEFVTGVLWQVTHSSEGHNAGLLGMYSKTGWWYYFPIAAALKMTVPFLALAVTSLVAGSWRVLRGERQLLWVLLPFAVYSAFLCFTGINIGVRYYLPAYALLFMLVGAMLAQLTSHGRLRLARVSMAVLLVGWCAWIAVRVYPDYMPYMNAFASSRPHWWYLSDSNVEWGDDVKPLADYLHARGETSVRAALLGGSNILQYYDIAYVDALSDDPLPQTRYMALGASFLNGSTVSEAPHRTEEQRVNRFDEFRHRTPEAIIGGSIYLFRMTN